jgi:hypothetical protein
MRGAIRLVPLALLASGCGAFEAGRPRTKGHVVLAFNDGPILETPPPAGGSAPLPSPPAPDSEDRKVLFSGSLAMLVPDAAAAEARMRAIVEEAKGWVHAIRSNAFTLRVPAAAFHETMQRIGGLGQVLDRAVQARDITDEYVDLELRLKNAEQVRDRLAALLSKAENVQQALEVERELARVTEEIERLKGKLRMLADQVAYATLTVYLVGSGSDHPRSPGAPIPFPWVRELGLHELLHFETR